MRQRRTALSTGASPPDQYALGFFGSISAALCVERRCHARRLVVGDVVALGVSLRIPPSFSMPQPYAAAAIFGVFADDA
jgi:hypothetical protein